MAQEKITITLMVPITIEIHQDDFQDQHPTEWEKFKETVKNYDQENLIGTAIEWSDESDWKEEVVSEIFNWDDAQSNRVTATLEIN